MSRHPWKEVLRVFGLQKKRKTWDGMNLTQAKEKLSVIGQEHLLASWDSLTQDQQGELLSAISTLDIEMFKRQSQLVRQPEVSAAVWDIAPLNAWDFAGSAADREVGKSRIASGKVGCLVVAGGQGTRLGFRGPKGLFPVSVIKHKTLFQLLAERVKAAGVQAGRPLVFAVMTSPINDAETRRYFAESDYFGLDPSQVDFFVQGVLPIISDQGDLFLQTPSGIAVGPDGNGFALHHFFTSGIWQKWKELGIEELCFIQVDNSLAKPFDAELVGHHHRMKAEATIKATHRRHADENVGVVVMHEGKVKVLEYTELPAGEKAAMNIDGSLQYGIANLSMFCFSMTFIKSVASAHRADFPLHLAHKPAKVLCQDGKVQEVKAWKCERFIFDVLPYAERVSVLMYERHDCYAPLKNGMGPDSLAAAQQALLALDQETYQAISGLKVPLNRPFELAPQFHYPTPQLLERWKNQPLPPDDYIEP